VDDSPGSQVFFYGHDHVFTDIESGRDSLCVCGKRRRPLEVHRVYNRVFEILDPFRVYLGGRVQDRLKISFVTPDPMIPEGKVLHSFDVFQSEAYWGSFLR